MSDARRNAVRPAQRRRLRIAVMLRALEERSVTSVGAGRPIPLRARVLVTTGRDLERLVEKNKEVLS